MKQCIGSYIEPLTFLIIHSMSIDIQEVHCGISQGSLMGPLLFNIFINDFVELNSRFDFIMYADDTTLVSTLVTTAKTLNILRII